MTTSLSSHHHTLSLIMAYHLHCLIVMLFVVSCIHANDDNKVCTNGHDCNNNNEDNASEEGHCIRTISTPRNITI